MERRLKTFKALDDQTIRPCCLRHVEKNNLTYPGKGFTCSECSTHIKCVWLDFNKVKSYDMTLYKQDNRIEDFIPLSAIVLRNNGDTNKEFSKKYHILNESITSGFEHAEKVESAIGNEYIFNKDISVSDIRVLRLGQDVFVMIGKATAENRKEKAINGVVFALGGGGRGRKKSMAAFAMSGGIVDPNPQVRNARLFG